LERNGVRRTQGEGPQVSNLGIDEYDEYEYDDRSSGEGVD
jgi:hypothetical protein